MTANCLSDGCARCWAARSADWFTEDFYLKRNMPEVLIPSFEFS